MVLFGAVFGWGLLSGGGKSKETENLTENSEQS
jgi:hypothetical protein